VRERHLLLSRRDDTRVHRIRRCVLIVGLFFRNPIIPALMLYGWEWINFLLPPLLKK
jgi:hypothetical protein